MNAARLGSVSRVLRVRQGLTQTMLATNAGVGRRAVSMLETGRASHLNIGCVDAILGALGARSEIRVLWNGPELERMLDAAHARLSALVKRRLEKVGWVVKVEVSYSRYGERGRIDLLAWHPATHLVLVIEIKTQLVDVQALLGSLDVKTRLARHVAEQFGWDVRSVVSAIVFANDRTTRRRLAIVDTLFDRYTLRGRDALSWLKRPTSTSGVLWFADARAPGEPRIESLRVRPKRPRTVGS